jgi:hemerythrin-like domain-containing protein
MLTATYTLVALSVEQATVRMNLQSFQKYVRSTLMTQNSVTLGQLEYACETLNQIYQACHWRKVDMYLIPAIREATERADQLLEELNHLNQLALESIRHLQEQYGALADGRDEKAGKICESIENFCSAMLLRLEREELELFAVARRVIGGDAWFDIANKLMLHDKEEAESRRNQPSGSAFSSLPRAVNARAVARRAAADAAAGNNQSAAPATRPALVAMPSAPVASTAALLADSEEAIAIPSLQALPVVNINEAPSTRSGLPARRAVTTAPVPTK